MSKFVNSLCSKLDIAILVKDSVAATDLTTALPDRAALKCLREETTLLALMVRVKNQERKEEYESRLSEYEEEQEIERAGIQGGLFEIGTEAKEEDQ